MICDTCIQYTVVQILYLWLHEVAIQQLEWLGFVSNIETDTVVVPNVP